MQEHHMTQEEVRSALIGLGSERLADTLLKEAERSTAIREMIDRITRTPQSLLAEAEEFIDYLEAADAHEHEQVFGHFISGLNRMITDLKETAKGCPHQTAQLLLRSLSLTLWIRDYCDEDDAYYLNVFIKDADDLFVEIVKESACADTYIELLFEAVENHRLSESEILKRAGEFFTPEQMRELTQLLYPLTTDEQHPNYAALVAIETLSEMTLDVETYAYARIERAYPYGDSYAKAVLDTAQLYLTAGKPERALKILGNIGSSDQYILERMESLLIRGYRETDRYELLKELLHKRFTAEHNLERFQQLQYVYSEEERQTILLQKVSSIMKDKGVHCNDVRFLLDTGFITEADSYILSRADKITRTQPSCSHDIIEALVHHNLYLSASLFLRAHVVSVLERKEKYYYRSGVESLLKLEGLETKIDDWNSLEDHDSFYARIWAKHKRTWTFWNMYKGKL
jgi:Arc/MetJ-type ribon-helix-helix transcriptional regulator